MYFWIAAYVAAAAAFYTYAVRTAKLDPLTESPETPSQELRYEPLSEQTPELVLAARD